MSELKLALSLKIGPISLKTVDKVMAIFQHNVHGLKILPSALRHI